MTIPILRKSANPSELSRQLLKRLLPLTVRRCGAWVVEISLIVASGVVPFSIGLYVQNHSTSREPLNPVLEAIQQVSVPNRALLVDDKNRQVTPATNVLWTAALIVPLVTASWQLYQLSKSGQTLPKRWFGVRVVTEDNSPPGFGRVLVREGLGRWALPLGTIFALWRYTSAASDLGLLAVVGGLIVLGDSAIALIDPQRRTLHDRLAKTSVLQAAKTHQREAVYFPAAPPRWLVQKERESGRAGEWGSGSVGKRERGRNFSSHPSPLTPHPLTHHPSPITHHLSPIPHDGGRHQHQIQRRLIFAFVGVAGLLGIFVGTQIYIQTQANRRVSEQQKNEVFLDLVKQLNATSNATPVARQAVILALGTHPEDSRTLQLLTELLSQEKDLALIEVMQQVLVRNGLPALPNLQRLNQSLSQALESQRYQGNPEARWLMQKKLWTTQVAIANILTLNSSQLNTINLSRTNLSQTPRNSTATDNAETERQSSISPFTLVLDNMDLSGINFRGASLAGASFQGSRFSAPGNNNPLGTFVDGVADLSGAELKDANLTGAILSHVSMENANLIRANLNQANLSQARLNGANLSSAKLIGANLRRAVLENASLTGADLTEADLSQANLRAARLGRVSAVGTQMQSADLTASDWRGSDLSGANLSRAKLQKADLSDTRLAGTNLHGAQLQNANFRNADLSMADLQGANLANADFQGAIFVRAQPTRPNPFIQSSPGIPLSARVKGVNFTQVKNLEARQLAYICAQGGRHPRCP